MTEKQGRLIDYACMLLENSRLAQDGRLGYRNKAHHTRRVAGWALRIGAEEHADMDVALAACAFHDVGYVHGAKNHETTGARMAREYLLDNGYGEAFTNEVCYIVKNHGDRGLLVPETPVNALVVIEADNLDEKGAMMLLRDAMAEGMEAEQSYEKTYRRILHHHLRGDKNICVTRTGRRMWEERQQAVKQFLRALERDLYFDSAEIGDFRAAL